MESADTLAARLAYQNPLEVADAIEADRAAVALAVLDEVIEACSKPMSIPFPMRAVLNDLRARYQKEAE